MSLFDAGFNTVVSIQHRRAIDLGRNNSFTNGQVARAIAQFLDAGAGVGNVDAVTGVINQPTNLSKAGATLVFSTSSGSVGAVINGVTVTGSGAGADLQDAAAAAAAINASVDALVGGWVRASVMTAQITLVSVAAGETISIIDNKSEYRFTATVAATGQLGQFSISGNDTADALALANAINAYPGLSLNIRAESVAGVVYIYAMDGSATGRVITKASAGTTINSQFAAATRCHVEAILPGAMGNAVTFTATGTGVTVANANTRLVGGLGGITGTIKRCLVGGAQ